MTNISRQYTKTSYLTGKENTRTIEAPIAEWQRFDEGQALIQDALRSVTAEDREFLITGATPEEWKELFGEEEAE